MKQDFYDSSSSVHLTNYDLNLQMNFNLDGRTDLLCGLTGNTLNYNWNLTLRSLIGCAPKNKTCCSRESWDLKDFYFSLIKDSLSSLGMNDLFHGFVKGVEI